MLLPITCREVPSKRSLFQSHHFNLIEGSPNRIHVRRMSKSLTAAFAFDVTSPSVRVCCAGPPFRRALGTLERRTADS